MSTKIEYTELHYKIINNERITKQMIDIKEINTFDKYGIPPLHYAIHMQDKELISLLLNNGADPLIRNKNGFNSYQESVCTRNMEIIELIYDKTYDYYEKIYEKRVEDGIKTLKELKDFSFELHWELQTWIPLAGYLLPSGNNLVRKKRWKFTF